MGFQALHLKNSRNRPTKNEFVIQDRVGTVKNCRNIPKLKIKNQQIMFSNFELLENVLVTKIENYFAEAMFQFQIVLF